MENFNPINPIVNPTNTVNTDPTMNPEFAIPTPLPFYKKPAVVKTAIGTAVGLAVGTVALIMYRAAKKRWESKAESKSKSKSKQDEARE